MLYHWGTLLKFGNSSSFKHKQLHYCLILIVRCRNPQVILSNSLSGAAIIDKVWQEGEEPQACRFPLFWKAAEQPEGQNGLEPIFCFSASLWGTCPKIREPNHPAALQQQLLLLHKRKRKCFSCDLRVWAVSTQSRPITDLQWKG